MTIFVRVLAFVVLATPSTHATSRGRNVVRRSCERFLFRTHARASDAFLARATARLEAGLSSLEEARWMGENALRYPEIKFSAARRNVVSRLHLLMSDPATAEVFFRAHPDNGLFLSDLIAVTEYAERGRYGFLRDPIEKLVTTSARTLARKFPGFDVVHEQAAALIVARWAGLRSEALVNAAETFLNPPRRRWVTHRWHEWRNELHNAYGYRASAAASYLRDAMAEHRVPADLLDRLVRSAAEAHHPHQLSLWEVFAVEGLAPAHVERLREIWQGLSIDPVTRRFLKHGSPALVNLLDQSRSNATR